MIDAAILTRVLDAAPGVVLAVWFGSTASGRGRATSDVDIAILSETPWRDGGPVDAAGTPLAVALERAIGRTVDLIDLGSAPPLLRFEISRTGQLLVERRPHAWTDFRVRAATDWWDWAPIARRMHGASLRRPEPRRAADMVRPDLAGSKVARASAWLEDAEARFGPGAAPFVEDRERRDLAIFYLFLAIQECIDLAAHWVVDAGWSAPDDAGSTFDVLAERGVLTHEHATTLRAAVGLRNRIAHGYAMLDYRRVHAEGHAGVTHLRTFLAIVSRAAGLGDAEKAARG